MFGEKEGALTVAELIAALEGIDDKTLPIQVQGCDCYQEAASVEVFDGWLLIHNTSYDAEGEYEERERLDARLAGRTSL